MNKDVILTRLQHLTGNLKSASDPSARDLNTLRTKLAQELIQNPELTVSGNRLLHEATPPAEPVVDSSEGFGHLDEKLVHGNRCDYSTGVDLARQHGLNRVH